MRELRVEEVAAERKGAIKIGPFGSALPRSAMVENGVKVYGQENLIGRDWLLGERRVSEDTFHSLRTCELEPGDVVIGMMGSLGHCEVFPADAEPGLMDSHLLRIQVDPETMIPEYLRLVLLSEDSARQIDQLSHGTIMAGLSSRVVKRIRFTVPPLEEQRRIAEILDTVDETIRAIERVGAKLSDLMHGLVADQLRMADEGRRVSLSCVAEISGGLAISAGRAVPDAVELPYLRVANVQDGYIDTSTMRTVRVSRADIDRYAVRRGDVLMNEGGDFDKLGRGAVWDGRIDPCLHQNHVFRVRCAPDLLVPEFLALFCQSHEAKSYFINNSKQTTNLASINKTQLGALPTLVPSLTRQREAVSVVDALRSRFDAEAEEALGLRALRTGLASDLLSGRVRTVSA